MPTAWLTPAEARAYLGVKADSTMCRLRAAGLPHYTLGGAFRYDRDEIDAWIRKHRANQFTRRHLRKVV